MTTASHVPVTRDMSGDELDAEDAWRSIRRHGPGRLTVEAFARFRVGDGFTSARALALQMALSLVPFLIGLTGLAADLDADQEATVLARTLSQLTPGGRQSDMLSHALAPSSQGAGDLALAVGVLFAIVAMTMSMGQVERGINRIYGIRGDRPGVRKYTRAAVLTAVLVVPVALGFMLLIAGGPFGDAMRAVYGWSETTETVWDVVRWPVGLAVTTLAITVVLDRSPWRHQPGLSWLGLGAGVAVGITMLASALLAAYVSLSDSFGSVYGPLAGIIALLLWCNLTSLALFFGAAMAAQLEALRAGVRDPEVDDPAPPAEHRRTSAAGYGQAHD